MDTLQDRSCTAAPSALRRPSQPGCRPAIIAAGGAGWRRRLGSADSDDLTSRGLYRLRRLLRPMATMSPGGSCGATICSASARKAARLSTRQASSAHPAGEAAARPGLRAPFAAAARVLQHRTSLKSAESHASRSA